MPLRGERMVKIKPINKKEDFSHKKRNPVPQENWGQRDKVCQRLG
jgi:hypothetical protein